MTEKVPHGHEWIGWPGEGDSGGHVTHCGHSDSAAGYATRPLEEASSTSTTYCVSALRGGVCGYAAASRPLSSVTRAWARRARLGQVSASQVPPIGKTGIGSPHEPAWPLALPWGRPRGVATSRAPVLELVPPIGTFSFVLVVWLRILVHVFPRSASRARFFPRRAVG